MKRPEITMERLRTLALGMIICLNAVATVVAFGESYFGLYRWATEHGVAGFWGGVWPMMVDLIILVAEAALFVAHHDKWKTRHKAWLWSVMFTALGVSTGANTGHVHSTDYLSHLTAALPPVALMFTMTVGFGVMKRTFMNKPAIRPAADISAADLAALRERADRELSPVSHIDPERPSHTHVSQTEMVPVSRPETPAEKPAPVIPESLDPTETFAGTDLKVTAKSYTMPRDPREGLKLPELRVRDMFDIDPDISVNAIKNSIGCAWQTAKNYLDATKEARGITA